MLVYQRVDDIWVFDGDKCLKNFKKNSYMTWVFDGDMPISREITLHFHEHDIQRLAVCSLSLAIKDNQCIPVCNYVATLQLFNIAMEHGPW